MLSTSEIQNNLDKIDTWLKQRGLPTEIPVQLKVFAYLGYLSTRSEELHKLHKKNVGGQHKLISDDLIRADTYLNYRKLLIDMGHEKLTMKKVLEFSVAAAKKLHELGEITDDELSIWTKADLKSMQNTLRKGLRELEEYSQMNIDN